jgi:hypothetical protein
MKNHYRSFVRIDEINFNNNLELSPSGFGDFVRWFRDDPILIGVALVQFEMYLFNPIGHVFVFVRLNVNRPLMRVSVFFSFFPEISCDVSVDDRFHYGESLKWVDMNEKEYKLCSSKYTLTRPPESGPKSVDKFIFSV